MTQVELAELIMQCRKAAMDICGSPLEEVAPINLLLNEAAAALEARIPQEDELREALNAKDAEIAELTRQLGGGCEANGGGQHGVIIQGRGHRRYAFCKDCGESLRGVRYCHER